MISRRDVEVVRPAAHVAGARLRAAWAAANPETRIASYATRHARDYALYPYGTYEEQTTPAGFQDVVVLWDSAGAAAASFHAEVDGARLALVAGDLGIVGDRESLGCGWRCEVGPLAGSGLRAVPEAHIAFWFAWAAFASSTEIWTAP